MAHEKQCKGQCGKSYPLTSEYWHRDGNSYKAVCRFCRNGQASTKSTRKIDKQMIDMTKSGNGRQNGLSMHAKPTKRVDTGILSNVWLSIKSIFVGLFLVGIFVGGFSLSALNGAFAFVDTAKSLSVDYGVLIAAMVAVVLTGATALSFHLFLSNAGGLLRAVLFLFFVATQTINLTINWQGVYRKQNEHAKSAIELDNIGKVAALRDQIAAYQAVIDRYPSRNNLGNPVTWKERITENVLLADRKKQELVGEIARLRMTTYQAHEVDWKIMASWVLIPEICMLISLISLSIRKKA